LPQHERRRDGRIFYPASSAIGTSCRWCNWRRWHCTFRGPPAPVRRRPEVLPRFVSKLAAGSDAAASSWRGSATAFWERRRRWRRSYFFQASLIFAGWGRNIGTPCLTRQNLPEWNTFQCTTHGIGQGILKGEVSLYHWPPAWLVWNQLYDNLQNRLFKTTQTGGQWYSDTSPFSLPWIGWYAHTQISD